jgi:CRISPR/Cas system Type II protein with McrA/HNH and RuvC-like nuclease domain
MGPLHSPKEYLFNLYTTSSGDAKRLWRKQIKESWNHKCAYCNSEENLTIDHIVPQSKGGGDTTENVVCCCHSCNQSKGHTPWEAWYSTQDFFCNKKYQKIKTWISSQNQDENLYTYRPRKNTVY